MDVRGAVILERVSHLPFSGPGLLHSWVGPKVHQEVEEGCQVLGYVEASGAGGFSVSVGSGVADLDFKMAILIWVVASLTRMGGCLGEEDDDEDFFIGEAKSFVNHVLELGDRVDELLVFGVDEDWA